MKLTPTSQQLLKLSLKKIMGKSGEAEDFPERIQTMASKLWSDFFDDEVAFDLNRDQHAVLEYLFSKEDVTEEEFKKFFKDTVPDFDERFQEYALAVKEETVRGRITMLGLMTDDEDLKSKLTEANSHADSGEWLRVEEVITTHFADFK